MEEITHETKLAIIREFMQERARRGGLTTLARNPNHFKEINKKSIESRRRNTLARLQATQLQKNQEGV